MQCTGFSLRWLLLLWSTGSRHTGFSSCGTRTLEHRLSSCVTGLVAPQHVGSSRTRARTRVPCIGRRILNHCATRDALLSFFMMRTLKIYSLSSFQMYNTVLLTVVSMLYVTFPGLIYLITGSLYLLTTFTNLSSPNPTPTWQPPVCSLYLCCCCF